MVIALITAGTIIVLAVLIVSTIRWYGKREERREAKQAGWALKGDLSAKQERVIIAENEAAAEIFRRLLAPSDSITEYNILSVEMRESSLKWLTAHESRKLTQ